MKENFKHKITVKVRFNEVDMLGVCNNAVYINFFEMARLEYIKALGMFPDGKLFSDGKLFFMVRNEINYKGHARFDDELNIYTKVSYIKNSSFGFDHLVENVTSKQIIADGKGVVAQINGRTRVSEPLSENFIKTVMSFDKNVNLLRE